MVFRPKQVLQSPPNEIAGLSRTGGETARVLFKRKLPVPHNETLEIFAFMDAALRSMKDGGKRVKLPAIR